MDQVLSQKASYEKVVGGGGAPCCWKTHWQTLCFLFTYSGLIIFFHIDEKRDTPLMSEWSKYTSNKFPENMAPVILGIF